MRLAIGVMALAGLYISIYFTLLTYRVVAPSARLVPAVCRLQDGACHLVVHTSPARILGGIPNALFGIAYYVFVLLAATLNAWQHPSVAAALIALGGVTVALALYLMYQLLLVMRVRCVLCIVSHSINVTLWVLFIQLGRGL